MITINPIATRFAPQQIIGNAIKAALLLLPTGQGMFSLAKEIGFDAVAKNRTSVLIATGIWWLVLIAFFMGIQGSPPAGPKLFRILDDPDLSSGERLKSTFTNWLGLLSIAVALVWVATSPFPP